MNNRQNDKATKIAIIGSVLIAGILIFTTLWMGSRAKAENEEAVRKVSLLYLDELAGRREQVVENNLKGRIRDLQVAVEIMEDDDLSDIEHLQAYQARMKRLYVLDKFAFVDTDGLIYTSLGQQDNIDDYDFDYKTISQPEISIVNLGTHQKKVIIAIPVSKLLEDKKLVACFMEIDMKEMLSGISMDSGPEDSTFCNIYTRDGIALTDMILGGLAEEDNLIEAMGNAEFEDGYTFERFKNQFQSGERSEVSFAYNGIKETLSFIPIDNTNWQLTYLIRESVIADKISESTQGIIRRSLVQSALTILAMLVMFIFILNENKRTAKYQLDVEKTEAELKGKKEEIEQRRQLQEQLEEQSQALSDALTVAEEASKAKTVFLSNMSHEIRTPMNAIIGLDSIALNDPETPPKTKEYLAKIGDSADHLLNLINDILDMSRIESGRMTLKKEEFSFLKLMETINTMFSSQCQQNNLEYQCYIDPNIEEYYIGDNMKLRQVLINILGNAVKFTPAGGKVKLSVFRRAQYNDKSTLEFVISDTGIGMSKEFLPHIFDTFAQEDNSTTNKFGSSGLGMAITKNIVEMMNGNIRVESEKGKGTTFTVTVTLEDTKREEKEIQADEINPSEMSVLIVDDDPVACEHAALVLKKAGIASDYVNTGDDAIKAVGIRHARNKPYNLILVDWKMPGMDGIETTRKIREIIGRESAIVILTAYHFDEVLEEAMAAGIDSFLTKPLFAQNVLDEYKQVMMKKHDSVKPVRQKADLKGRRILLAEDVAINAEIIMMLLESKEIKCDHAENGAIAVKLFREHPEGYYDAILMDMRMPEMDGLEATRMIRNEDRADAKRIPIIALTANAFDEDVQRSLQAGLNAHLSKPVHAEDLFHTLETLIQP